MRSKPHVAAQFAILSILLEETLTRIGAIGRALQDHLVDLTDVDAALEELTEPPVRRAGDQGMDPNIAQLALLRRDSSSTVH